MIGSIFQLVHVDRNDNGIWTVQMKLCTSSDHQLKLLSEHMKNEYNDEENTLLSFCDILLKMGKFNDAEKYFHRFLKGSSHDHKYLARCYHSLGVVATEKYDLDSSLA